MRKKTKVRVVRWVSFEEASKLKESVGGLGGVRACMTWRQYLGMWLPRVHPYLEAIRTKVLQRKIKRGGNWHQDRGCPVFSDGTCASFSMRAWGDLMAAIWNTAEKRGRARRYMYTDFAWS